MCTEVPGRTPRRPSVAASLARPRKATNACSAGCGRGMGRGESRSLQRPRSALLVGRAALPLARPLALRVAGAKERLQRLARGEPLLLFAQPRAEEREPLPVRIGLQQRLEAERARLAVERVHLTSVPPLDRLDLGDQLRRQVLQPNLASRVDEVLTQRVVAQVARDAALDLALHLLPKHLRPLLEKLLPEPYGAPQAPVGRRRAASEGERALDGVCEAGLLAEALLRVDKRDEELLRRSLLRGEALVGLALLLLVRVREHLDLGLEVGVPGRNHRRVEDAPQPHAVDDAVLADVLDSVLRLLRHLLELVEVEDNAHLCERARLRLHVRHHEAAGAVEEDVVVHRAVARLEDVEDGRGVRQVGGAEREERHHAGALLLGRLHVRAAGVDRHPVDARYATVVDVSALLVKQQQRWLRGPQNQWAGVGRAVVQRAGIGSAVRRAAQHARRQRVPDARVEQQHRLRR
mmetsp:Transcript_20311/g.64910  ORF Transcript_20311/g.64910 Transcript_20311/m.64910 type:complete len:464 (-) Transcript_20311:17-1408(-)